ncbi:coiled-coil domain-containing protein 192-like isoform X1 [Mobula hypostoma]|uniref:coiled-coil domain-containing protein 192-like isoform X1 n=1 Tax=Mobula hypostoma TaxID=723540 RepID=UPI002FC35F15
MGNAVSGQVKVISVKPDKKERVSNSVTRLEVHSLAKTNNNAEENPNCINDMVKGLNVPQISSILDRSETDSRLHEAEEKARTLTKELTEMEMCKVELSDQVIWLEEQLEIMGNKLSSAGLYEETLIAKDKYIQRLEAENKCSNAQLVQLKQKHKRIVRKLQIKLAQVKQDSAISVTKAKERIQALESEIKLTKEQIFNNKHLKEDLRSHASGAHKLSLGEESRMRLVLELSMQLSQQQEKILLLEKTLEEKDRQLTGLAAQQFTQPAARGLVHLLLQPDLPTLLQNNTCTTKCDQRLGAVPFLASDLTSNRSQNSQVNQS